MSVKGKNPATDCCLPDQRLPKILVMKILLQNCDFLCFFNEVGHFRIWRHTQGINGPVFPIKKIGRI